MKNCFVLFPQVDVKRAVSQWMERVEVGPEVWHPGGYLNLGGKQLA